MSNHVNQFKLNTNRTEILKEISNFDEVAALFLPHGMRSISFNQERHKKG